MAAGKRLSTLINRALDFFFTARCVGCGRRGDYLCSACFLKLPAADLREPEIFALFAYRDPRVKKIIWLLKYKGVEKVSLLLAQALYDRIGEELSSLNAFFPDGSPWLLIPVPASKRGMRRRGFNQAEALARGLVAIDRRNFELGKRLLVKIRETKSQVEVGDRRQRLRNLRGAFAVKDAAVVKERSILVIDDVITTGGTIGEARRVLKEAGARRIVAVVVAHG